MTTTLITGAGRGIGHALAAAALAAGHVVYGSVRDPRDGDRLKAEFGAAFHPLVFDVTDYAAMKAAIAGIGQPVDILVNNAGIIGPEAGRQTTLSMDFAGFAETLAINTLAPLAVSQAVLPLMRQAGKGVIVSISSGMSYMGQAQSDRIAYRASKVAMNKVMQGLATDLKRDRIVVLVIDPGWVQTEMGGAGAPLPAATVANGILALAARAEPAMSGKFFLHSGEERAY